MSILSTVRRNGKRVYIAVQTLLITATALAAAAYFLAPGESSVSDWLLFTCLALSIAGLGLLEYLKRTVTDQLRDAVRIEAERTRLTENDLLTGALTRGRFLDELNTSIGTLSKPRRIMLLLVDLDHFKQLNDGFGHQFGDEALAHLVACAKHCFPDCTIGRLGGDEFAILMYGNDLARCRSRAEKLLAMLQRGRACEGHQIPLGASIGIAVAPQHASSHKELPLLADLALYESKGAGRGRITVFDPDMLSEKRQRRFMERELRAAIYLNELELHYQPLTDSERNCIELEGLVRWRHPVRGMVSPAEFIPVAERSNLIDMVGEWVFRRACLDLDRFACNRISINVSGEQLKRDGLVHMLDRVLRETGASANRFVLEITETVATAATPEIIARIERLREMGFHIALDDFGTGHCGFNYIKTLPIDAIKIDRSYIRNLGHDRIAQVFVSALTQIARIQGLTIVAEGIETEEEFDLARAAGCNRFQGYFLGRPEAAPAIRRKSDNVERLALTA
ncbi:bifunctional diguanylate cyclase/phosphodiesterase [Nitratireductor sp. L1-7-SE]|uniref:Bifunctional diguanylate cyclase/phosphodiesterase n=1 Tax=Nitratireductor rhodophyticola TaxID=2854036 RepID=A0ABS7R9R8_9HYPH|nr:bifunctional diguanylate cyclase/phosphodiesterase [Nitratireductor rhodophyticola]MBY8917409.1 bifunctional diguanylate cyclase/phosphodiesterase [Nitratireductor rhodophyticola]MBY8922120.1 bifunctional diguanylate cyclase/phosphodiesterase [Nitratireductor rhodophyticola]